MYRYILCLLLTASQVVKAQEMIQVEGAVTLQNTQNGNPTPGTIRWTGNDFEGWNGLIWVSLSGGKAVGSVTDYIGKAYPTVKIGEQVWMAENLNTAYLNDGTYISKPGIITLPGAISGRYYYGDNEGQFGAQFGALYDWSVASTGKLCPLGWHIPSNDEWNEMREFLGGEMSAGGKLKSTGVWSLAGGTGPWNLPNTGAENSYGFSGIPGGRRLADGTYSDVYEQGHYWTSTQIIPAPNYYSKVIGYDNAAINEGSIHIFDSAASVRCVKD